MLRALNVFSNSNAKVDSVANEKPAATEHDKVAEPPVATPPENIEAITEPAPEEQVATSKYTCCVWDRSTRQSIYLLFVI